MQTTITYCRAVFLATCISITCGSKEAHFKKIHSGAPAVLDDDQNLQGHKVFEVTACATRCAQLSCQEFQYSEASRLCITRHPNVTSGGVINPDRGLFDTYSKQVIDPTTCSEIRNNNPTAQSGEYNIMPSAPQFRGMSVKVYCLMNDTHQLEYVTLPNENIGNFPKRSKGNCFFEVPYLIENCAGSDGITVYLKIRIIPTTMSVVTNDTTFTSGNKTQPHWFGVAEDCYSYVKYCKRIGTFHIDTFGTGMKFATDLEWIAEGEAAKVYSIKRKHGGAVIDLVCGGWSGWCIPVGDMVLYPNTMDPACG